MTEHHKLKRISAEDTASANVCVFGGTQEAKYLISIQQ